MTGLSRQVSVSLMADSKQDRAAEALRRNLKRRKEQARARQEDSRQEGSQKDTPESEKAKPAPQSLSRRERQG
ncbi:MAG: hypothetical protein AAFY02_14190 [Pseudomonadota bacterium]